MTSTAREYATALFALAKESGQEARFLEALELVKRALSENPAYVELLCSPAIPKAERLCALTDAFGDSLPPEVMIFLQLLCKAEHIRAFFDCFTEFTALYRASEHIAVGRVVCAAPLTEDEKENLLSRMEKLCGHQVLLEYTVDASLLGGITVEIDGKILDGSLKHRLHQVKEVIAK